MTKLYDSLNSAIIFCRIFGLGLWNNYTWIAYFNDIFLLLLNLVVGIYGFIQITYYIFNHMPKMWNITTIVSVIRVYINMIGPPLVILFAQFKKRALTDILEKIDNLVPWIGRDFLRSFMRYSVKWLLVNMSTEIIIITMFNFNTNFDLFAIKDYLLIAVYNMWLVIPLLQYVFVIKTVDLGVWEINRRINSIEDWIIIRKKWKALRHLVIDLTKNVVGDIIIIHFTNKIADIVFFIFSLYFYGIKRYSLFVIVTDIYNIIIGALWMFELFRQCQNCKQQVSII